MITSFPITPNWAEKDALLFGYPKLKPTVPLPTSQIPKYKHPSQGYSLSRNHLEQNRKGRERLELSVYAQRVHSSVILTKSLVSCIRDPSDIVIIKRPKKIYHKSKDSCFLKWAPTKDASLPLSSSSVLA